MKFAVVADWPEVKNAEYEVIKRLQVAAKNIGCECVVVDGQGYDISLNKKGYSTNKIRITEESDIDFVFNLHFASAKLFDCFMYATTWNPPKFFHDWGYATASGNFVTSDDYCIYESLPILAHMQNLLFSSRRTLQGAFQMVPSVPKTELEPLPSDRKLKVFYSGVNWERLGNKHGRHHELFELLDKTGFMQFYGPFKFLGQQPWAGFKSYQGEIPFDGTTTLDVINKCGVSLVLSSDIHRDSHAATNRLYESLEAGAIIISDDNPFVMENFGDVVLPITYSKSHSKTFEQITKHLEWIQSHRDEAREMALKGQSRYREKYGLEMQLKRIVEGHADRQAQVYGQRVISKDVGKVTVVLPITQFFDELLARRTLKSIEKQLYKNVEVIFAVSKDFVADVESFANTVAVPNKLLVLENETLATVVNEEIIIPRGRVLQKCLQQEDIKFAVVCKQGDYFFRDHLGALLYPLIKEDAVVSHSGWVGEDRSGHRHMVFSGKPVSEIDIGKQRHRGSSSSVMFKMTDELKTVSLWFIDDFLESFLCSFGLYKKALGYTQNATVVSLEHEMFKETCLDVAIQQHAINDCFNYNYDFAQHCQCDSGTGVAASYNDKDFKDTLKRILWHKFDKFPRFQRFCQKINSWI